MGENTNISGKRLIQKVKLSALLEVTKAINNNLSTAQLIDLYQNILENRLGVGKLILFHFSDEWTCILKYGVGEDFNTLGFDEELLKIQEIETITFNKGELSRSFEIVIPVFHKKIPLAYVLLGDVNQEKLELSAAIKHLPFIQTLTNIIVVAVENKKLYKEHIQQEKLNKELELAQDMQEMLFPNVLPNTDGIKVAAKYVPHEQVGGDYYDFIKLNNHEFIFCVADVSGKGVAAALLMSNIQATLHSLINYTHNLKDIILELNKRVLANTKHEKFVSVFLAKLNTKSQQLTYINAGHNPPLLYIENKFMELSKGCTILGIVDSNLQVEVETFDYASDFTLLCYTDGLTDTYNSDNKTVTVDNLRELIEKNNSLSPEKINDALFTYAEEFKGEIDFPDDIALLTLKIGDLNF